jgi:gas vesicle protein
MNYLTRALIGAFAGAVIGGYISLYAPLITRDRIYSATQPSLDVRANNRDMAVGMGIGGLAGLIFSIAVKENKSNERESRRRI